MRFRTALEERMHCPECGDRLAMFTSSTAEFDIAAHCRSCSTRHARLRSPARSGWLRRKRRFENYQR
ncbi:MAG: hypothetical protein L0Z53_11975 [Acidobacteriales bacterium]|nr:hypothetical protein [Terriglobales bacterium]